MNMGHLWYHRRGVAKYLKGTCSSAILNITNFRYIGSELNPGFHSEKRTTDHLNHDTGSSDVSQSFESYFLLLLLLLQSALQPFWVMACSTIAEYSQQEGLYRVPLPAARQSPNLEDQWLERSNSRHQVSLMSETTRANPSSGRWSYLREIAENFAESDDFHITFKFFYMP